MKQMKFLSTMLVLTALFSLNSHKAYAHCEIPCGIYTDSLRIELIAEHITTIEKSMLKIVELSEASDEDYHMITRWTINKEEHAQEIQDIVSQYFLHQRIKPTDDLDDHYAKYINELTMLHKMLVYAMKTKQTTDTQYVEKLRELLSEFAESYFGHHEH